MWGTEGMWHTQTCAVDMKTTTFLVITDIRDRVEVRGGGGGGARGGEEDEKIEEEQEEEDLYTQTQNHKSEY